MAGANPPDFTKMWRDSWEEWTRAWTGLAQPPAAQAAGGGKQAASPTPAEAWKRSMDRWISMWTQYFESTTNTPEFAHAAGQAINTMLDVRRPFAEATEDAMAKMLESMNMPTREEIVRLARQINEVNARLDELGDRVEAIQDGIEALLAQSSAESEDGSRSRRRSAAGAGGAR